MGRLKKLLVWLVVAFCVYAVFKSPDQAAGIVKAAGNGIADALKTIGHFFDALLK